MESVGAACPGDETDYLSFEERDIFIVPWWIIELKAI